MAVGQLASWPTYRRAVASHGLGRASDAAAILLLSGEIAASAGLFAHAEPVPVAVLALAVTAAWGILAAQAFVRRRNVPNCACFGRFMRQELRWWVLLEDVAFVGLAALHLRSVL